MLALQSSKQSHGTGDEAKTKTRKETATEFQGGESLRKRTHQKKWQSTSPRKVFACFLELPLPSS
jgi:hypothetical protein